MSFLTRAQPILRSATIARTAPRLFSTAVVYRDNAVKDAAKSVDRAVSDTLVKGIDKGGQSSLARLPQPFANHDLVEVKNKAAAAAGKNASKAEGAASEISGEAKGKAAELKVRSLRTFLISTLTSSRVRPKAKRKRLRARCDSTIPESAPEAR